MRRFLAHIGILAGTFMAVLIFLDILYSAVYAHSNSNRLKVQQAVCSSSVSFDFVLLGSSRTVYSVNTKSINDSLGTCGYNFAYPAAQSFEMMLLLKVLLKNNNHIKRLIVEVDNVNDNWDRNAPYRMASASFMPFIYRKEIRTDFLGQSGYWASIHIPFFRYIIFGPKLGIREVLSNLVFKKKTQYDGFEVIPGSNGESARAGMFQYMINKKSLNLNFCKIIKLCEINNIDLHFFTPPILNLKGPGHEVIKQLLGGMYHDFSSDLQDKTLYRDAVHLNMKGAEQFTNVLMNFYLLDLKKLKDFNRY